jgi:type II secretory pathway pseudopilin PulG
MLSKYQTSRSANGYSLVEALLGLVLMGWLAIISIPNIYSMYIDYKLTTATRQLATAIQFARGKSVSENYNFSLTMSGTNAYQVSGAEIDSNGNATPEPWEDRNNDGTLSSKSYPSEIFTSGVEYVPDVSIYSAPSLVDTSPTPQITFPSTTTTDPLTFEPLGSLINGTDIAIFRKNTALNVCAVTVTKSGKVQSWKLRDSVWVRL